MDKLEAKLAESKVAQQKGESMKETGESLTRKVQLLEEELDAAEKNLKETTERLVHAWLIRDRLISEAWPCS